MYYNNKVLMAKNNDKEFYMLLNMVNKHGLIAGGTGLYINSIVYDMQFEDENSNENTSSGKENDNSSESSKDKDKNQKKIFVREKGKENGDEVIVFSTSVNDRDIKSMTNSSKIYVNEIFKQNWKLKSRRLITKLKKKLIKEYKNKCFKELTEVNNNHIKNSYFKNNIILDIEDIK